MMNRVAVLDLGASKASLLVAEVDERDRLRIVASAYVPNKGVKNSVVVDIDDCAGAIRSAVTEAQDKADWQIEGLWVAVGGAHVEAQVARGIHPIYPKSRQITRDDVLQVVTHSRKQLLPPDREELQSIPFSYSIDGQRGISKPIGMSGSRLEVETLLITAQRTHIQNLEHAVAVSGRKTAGLCASTLAAGLGCLKKEEIELGAAVVDLGAGSTSIAVFDGGSMVYAGTIPIGSNHITSDVMKLLKTSPEEAERLKTGSGSALAALAPPDDSIGVLQLGQIHERPMQRRVLCEIVESRAKEIATFAKQQIERSGYYGLLPAGVVLTGGGAKLDGTVQLFEDLMPGHRVRVGMPKSVGAAEVESPNWSVAVGLARYALDQEAEQIGAANLANGLGERVKTIWSLLSGKSSL